MVEVEVVVVSHIAWHIAHDWLAIAHAHSIGKGIGGGRRWSASGKTIVAINAI